MNFTQPKSKHHTSQGGTKNKHQVETHGVDKGGTKNKGDLHANLKLLEKASFQTFFREHGLREEEILGDGNCFFSACAQQEIWLEKISSKDFKVVDLDYRQRLSWDMRQDVCDFMRDAGDDYSCLFVSKSHTADLFSSSARSFDEYILKMRRPLDHADEMVVAAVARQRKHDIQVYKYDDEVDGIRMILYPKDPTSQDGQDTAMNQDPNCDLLGTPDTVRIVYYAHQLAKDGHYNSIIADKVCERSLDPSPLD